MQQQYWQQNLKKNVAETQFLMMIVTRQALLCVCCTETCLFSQTVSIVATVLLSFLLDCGVIMGVGWFYFR